MKHIGILTFHRAHNYGAILQAYALQECLKGLGYEVSFIDYNNKKLLAVYKLFNFKRVISKNPFKTLKNILKEITTYTARAERSKVFEAFIIENLSINSQIDFDYINSHFDAVFVGSDQVWNHRLTRGFDPYYWGTFKQKNSTLKLISYAASMEISNFTVEEKSEISRHLTNFDIISVRENNLKENLKALTNQEITVVADPTLLLNPSVWSKIAASPKIDKPYLLLYQVRSNEQNNILAKRVAQHMNLEIIYLSARIDAVNSAVCIAASPADYLGLFKHATFILCSSFHGTVFSALFNVPFYSILMNDGKDSRSISLLNYLNLSTRAITYDSELKDEQIDWKKVQQRLAEIQNSSIIFLKNALK